MKRVIKKQKNTLPFHLMLIIPVIITLIFCYTPMLGLIIAFQNYKPGLGFLHSEWVGIGNFVELVKTPGISKVLWNTLFMASGKIVANVIFPIILALMLNEVRVKWFKKTVQTITYLPYFLSWVILSGIMVDFLSPSGGFVNSIITSFGGKEIYFLGKDNLFPYTMIISAVWKNLGFNTIVYLAALTGISPTLYEAAGVDGAGRWQQTMHITLPGIAQFIALMSILGIGNILNAGFDQVFNLYSPAVYNSGDIIDTLVYRMSMVEQRYSLGTAVGLFKSVISLILISVSYKLADKYAGYRVF